MQNQCYFAHKNQLYYLFFLTPTIIIIINIIVAMFA